ncbi:MAG: class I SAM-dependent methyltransferase [Planctomycetota bacterium]
MKTTTADGITRVLEERLTTGIAEGAGGERVDIGSFALSREAADVLAAITAAAEPDVIIEVGCASAVSTLAMLRAAPASRVIAMDPKQHTHWNGIGERAIALAGVQDRVGLHLDRSDAVLPRLVADGVRTQMAFIDGWHMLDYVMVEAHLVDLMLDTGGVIVLHDMWMPALQHFACFWTTNRGYEPVTVADGALTDGAWPPDLPRAQREIDGPTGGLPRFESELVAYVDRSVLAVRKTGEDARVWDDFEPYV